MQNDLTLGQHLTKTVCGVLCCKLQKDNMAAAKFLTQVYDYNPQIPPNLMLLCGDNHLDILVPALLASTKTAANLAAKPYVVGHNHLRDYIRELATHYKETENKELVVFIDTNPAMTIYTHIALCAMTELIVPLNADDYSLQVNNPHIFPPSTSVSKHF